MLRPCHLALICAELPGDGLQRGGEAGVKLPDYSG
jgi:hypothetical protein